MNTIHELENWISSQPDLDALYHEIRSRLDDDPGHDLGHLLRVALWTIRLGEDRVAPREAVAAALLHDVVNVPKDSPDRARASTLCAELARELLPRFGFSEREIARIHDAIRDHSFSRGAVPENELGRSLQDADRLEALGSIGIMRVISTGARMKAGYFDWKDPWARERPLDDRRYSVDHFFTKLNKLAATMNTETGRREAERRSARMTRFLADLGEELGSPLPG